MERKIKIVIFILCVAFGFPAGAQQVQINTDYHTRSNFVSKDDKDTKIGDGDMVRYSLKYVQPLSLKLNERHQPKAWALLVNATYAQLDDRGAAKRWNPDEILNAGVTLSYLTPINPKWSIMASLGAGVYAQANHIRWQSVLANGSCIFAYKATPYFSIGAGVGLTNAYGPPMVMPMFYLNWKRGDKYQFEVNMVNMISAKASTRFTKNFKLTWTAIEMDNLIAVVWPETKGQIYSSMMLKTYLTPEYYFAPKFSVFGNVGANFSRSSRISDRKIGAMFSNLGGADYRFKPAGFFSLGLRYGF